MVAAAGRDSALIKALARAFRWRRMLDECGCGTIADLANRKALNRGYMSQVLCLKLLAPEIVEAALDGRQQAGLQLEGLLAGSPEGWDALRARFG